MQYLQGKENWFSALKSNRLFYLLLALYIGANCLLFTFDFYWLTILPAVIVLGWLLFYHPQKVILFLAFATPLSLKVDFEDFNLSLSLPTEPLLILLMPLFWFKLWMGGRYDDRIFTHPISLAIFFNLFWVLVTSATSTMPLVSFKFFLARFWFVTVFYFFGVLVFKNIKNVKTFFYLFSISLCGVIFYALYRHARMAWEQNYANMAPNPFFTDHGVYAAVIALILPVMLFFLFKPKIYELKLWQRFLAFFIVSVLIIGLVMSFTRAAWIGIGAAAIMLIFFMLRLKLTHLFIAGAAVVGVLLLYQTEIKHKLQSNKKVSDDNIETHIKSIYNISTDASNTERINRWRSAWRMFSEKPVFGWGPGTYMFQYAPFQHSSEMTIISTRTGTLGNAHSEYIGPLAESGVFGTLSILLIVLVSTYKSMQLIYYGKNKLVKNLTLALILGLITYYVHGFLNNYLDVDKAAIPVFAFLAIITTLDIYHNRPPAVENALQQPQQ